MESKHRYSKYFEGTVAIGNTRGYYRDYKGTGQMMRSYAINVGKRCALAQFFASSEQFLDKMQTVDKICMSFCTPGARRQGRIVKEQSKIRNPVAQKIADAVQKPVTKIKKPAEQTEPEKDMVKEPVPKAEPLVKKEPQVQVAVTESEKKQEDIKNTAAKENISIDLPNPFSNRPRRIIYDDNKPKEENPPAEAVAAEPVNVPEPKTEPAKPAELVKEVKPSPEEPKTPEKPLVLTPDEKPAEDGPTIIKLSDAVPRVKNIYFTNDIESSEKITVFESPKAIYMVFSAENYPVSEKLYSVWITESGLKRILTYTVKDTFDKGYFFMAEEDYIKPGSYMVQIKHRAKILDTVEYTVVAGEQKPAKPAESAENKTTLKLDFGDIKVLDSCFCEKIVDTEPKNKGTSFANNVGAVYAWYKIELDGEATVLTLEWYLEGQFILPTKLDVESGTTDRIISFSLEMTEGKLFPQGKYSAVLKHGDKKLHSMDFEIK